MIRCSSGSASLSATAVQDVEVRDVARLGREPALADDPVVQRLLVEEALDHSDSPGTSWNQ
jgi:hypothetical protein